jgi:glucose-6-phosphate dehydrogenase assembly protein OpcA
LQRRDNRDCLIEELRRLDPDEVYEASLRGLGRIGVGTSAKAAAKQKSSTAGKRPAKAKAKNVAEKSAS